MLYVMKYLGPSPPCGVCQFIPNKLLVKIHHKKGTEEHALVGNLNIARFAMYATK